MMAIEEARDYNFAEADVYKRQVLRCHSESITLETEREVSFCLLYTSSTAERDLRCAGFPRLLR